MLILKSIYLTAIMRVIKATRKGMKISKRGDVKMQQNTSSYSYSNKPSGAFIGASWGALGIGIGSYMIGLWNATIQLNEKGFYFAVFLLGLFSAVTLQKSVRDKLEGLPITNIFLGISWVAFAAAIALLVIGLINAQMELSEKGYYGVSFVLSLFAVITVQKNVRDLTNEQGVTDSSAFPGAESGLDLAGNASDIMDN